MEWSGRLGAAKAIKEATTNEYNMTEYCKYTVLELCIIYYSLLFMYILW